VVEDTQSNTTYRLTGAEMVRPSRGGTLTARIPFVHRVVGAAFVASLLLVPPTAGVRWDDTLQRGLGTHSNLAGAELTFERSPLEQLAHTAVERMTPERRALYEAIMSIRDGFGSPVDVNRLLREIRENA